MSKNNNKRLVFGALALGAVATAAYFLLVSGKKKDDEDVAAFTAPAPSTATAAPRTAAPAAAPSAADGAASASPATASTPTSANAGGSLQREMTTTYSFSANEENERMLEEALKEAKLEQSKQAAAPKADAATGRIVFKNLGVSIAAQPGWIVNEEMSPMPNVAMITFSKPEFAAAGDSQLPGSTPVVILSVEDITTEGLSLLEFKDKSKNMALTQMMMMTGGMFQPQVTYDDTMRVGAFGHCLEYQQRTPYFTMQVMNLLQVSNGLAYVFQLMANPDVMTQYKQQVLAIAKSVELSVEPVSVDFERNSCVKVTTSRIEVKVPSSWMQKAEADSGAELTFRTASMAKGEAISIYSADAAPIKPSAPGAVEGTRKSKAITDGTFTLVMTPLQAGTDLITDDATLTAVLKSITPATAAAPSTFRTTKYGYQFEIVAGARIIESRLGDGTVVYAPQGIPSMTESGGGADGPIVTIRVGDKKTDPDCEETLGEWFAKLQADADAAPISELRKTSINGVECVTFLNKEMTEVGAGQREERIGRVYIFVVKGKTTLIRWETSTGNWRKFERKLESMMNSFKLL